MGKIFCGSYQHADFNSTSKDMLWQECVADGIALGIHVLSITITVLIVIIITWKERKIRKHSPECKWVKFPHHIPRWILHFLLVVFNVLLLTEALLAEHGESAIWNIHSWLPDILAAIAVMMLIVLYDLMEKNNKPVYLIIPLLYWTMIIGVLPVQLHSIYHHPEEIVRSPRFVYGVVLLILYGLCWIMEISLLIKLKYFSRSSRRVLKSARELSHLIYLQPYVSLLSQITWHWIGAFLTQGYRKQLELADLGTLPKKEKSEEIYRRFKHIYEKEKIRAKALGKPPSLWRTYFWFSWRHMLVTGLVKLLADQMMYIGPMMLSYVIGYIKIEYEIQVNNGTANSRQQVGSVPEFDVYFYNGYILAVYIFLATIVCSVFWQNQFYHCLSEGIRVKGAVQNMVLDKVTRLSSTALNEGDMSRGQSINHMSTDALNIFWFFYVGHFAWQLPVLVLVGIFLLYAQLGVSALLSCVLFAVMAPVNYLLGKRLSLIQDDFMKQSDERLKQSRELLDSIKLLKLYAWEGLFCKAVLVTRKKELWLLFLSVLTRITSLVITLGTPIFACLLTVILYPHFEDDMMGTGRIYSAIALFSILGLTLWIVYFVTNVVGHGYVSTNRIQRFLQAQEVQPEASLEVKDHDRTDEPSEQVPLIDYVQTGNGLMKHAKEEMYHERPQTPQSDDDSEPHRLLLEITGASFSWEPKGKSETTTCCLNNIDLKLHQGQLYVIVGQVGCGKSSLLSTLLNETFLQKGLVNWKKKPSVAYVPQKAWLMNATLRENVLFGHEMDAGWYKDTLEMCALESDLKTLLAGDQTEIGEKGINLSGGQKQRVSLARAVYSQADFIVLDDPLSALDAPVAHHIMSKAILGHLLPHGKTVILATHQVKYLHHADWVISLQDGCITYQGAPSDLNQETERELMQLLETDNVRNEAMKDEAVPTGNPVPKTSLHKHLLAEHHHMAGSHLSSIMGSQSIIGTTSNLYDPTEEPVITPSHRHSTQRISEDSHRNEHAKEEGKLIDDEEHQYGAVPVWVYVRYARAASWALVLLACLGFSSYMGVRIVGDYWLGMWMDQMEMTGLAAGSTNMTDGGLLNCTSNASCSEMERGLGADNDYYLRSYISICVSVLVLIFVAVLCQEMMTLNAARNLHKNFVTRIITAPMRFFDVTPTGRILNRMSGDTNTIDIKMAVTANQVFFCVLYVCGGIIINAVASPFFLIPALPMFAVYFIIQRFYIKPSRELQRLDCITKSPILNEFSEALDGLASIRAYRVEERYQKRMFHAVDDNNASFLFLHTANVWMGIRLDVLGACIVFAASMSSITACLHGFIPPSQAGLAIAYAVMISSILNWAMRGVSELEMFFNSVERVVYYTDVEQEPQTPDKGIESDWPSQGTIQYENVSLRYDTELVPVITDFSLSIPAGQKVGIYGRTGSGKSTLTLGLFRLIQICQGRILIDGVDIQDVSLQRLRSSIAIIPQDPVLFCGTIRFNVDPEGSKTDATVWQALEIAQLKATIQEFPTGLETQITEGGENFSAGQRQLFCLARAFLRQCPILVMDEATASIDLKTDNIIQDIIHTAFGDRTVLVIAHRTSTILNCDVILVIQDGRLVEHDSPQNLLKRDSIFADMVKQH